MHYSLIVCLISSGIYSQAQDSVILPLYYIIFVFSVLEGVKVIHGIDQVLEEERTEVYQAKPALAGLDTGFSRSAWVGLNSEAKASL
jgi:hypothetical protein